MEIEKLVVRPPSFDLKAKPVNPRFVRKVLYNHERTQRKLDTSSKQAGVECGLTKQIVEDTTE